MAHTLTSTPHNETGLWTMLRAAGHTMSRRIKQARALQALDYVSDETLATRGVTRAEAVWEILAQD